MTLIVVSIYVPVFCSFTMEKEALTALRNNYDEAMQGIFVYFVMVLIMILLIAMGKLFKNNIHIEIKRGKKK